MIRSKRVAALLGWALVLPMILGAAACTKKLSEEDRVRAVIRQAIEAANEKKAGEVVEDAAPGFKGPGGHDVRDCRRLLTGYFLQRGWLKVFERQLDVRVEGANARAGLEVLVARGNPVESIEDVLPNQASRLAFELTLEKREGAWRFTQATYQQRPLVEP